MVEKKQVLAVIPARGGSKGVPRKNIRKLAGYPLIAYSITAALRASTVTRVVVSTDDEEIAAVARECGAETPFLRPAEFAQDRTLDLPVFQHALNWFAENENFRPDVVVQLRPTSPIRPVGLVDDAVNLLLAHPEADSVRGIVPSGQNPHKMWRVDAETHQMTPLLTVPGIDEAYNAPRQALPPTFWQTGHIDAIRPNVILEKNSMSGKPVLGLPIDPRYTIDIDNERDFALAEWMIRNSGLAFEDPAAQRRSLPENPVLLVMDFDGVLTDNRVWVDDAGREAVMAYRSDSLGLGILRRETRIQPLVLSMETNPVVTARAKKMNVPVLQGINDKPVVLKQYLAEHNINPADVIYIGNDVNDLPCFTEVGFAAAPADSMPEVLRAADLVLSQRGGHGAVRELSDILLQRSRAKKR